MDKMQAKKVLETAFRFLEEIDFILGKCEKLTGESWAITTAGYIEVSAYKGHHFCPSLGSNVRERNVNLKTAQHDLETTFEYLSNYERIAKSLLKAVQNLRVNILKDLDELEEYIKLKFATALVKDKLGG